MIFKIKPGYFLILLCLVFCFGCKSTQKNSTGDTTETTVTESTAYKTLAEKWGGEVKYDFNTDRSMVLAQSVPATDAKELSFSYFVFDMKTEKVRTKGTVYSGAVQWLSLNEIEVFNTPGKMRTDQTRDDFTVVIDVLSGKQTPKTEWNK